jgi:DNA-3-methyladenine glycosylase
MTLLRAGSSARTSTAAVRRLPRSFFARSTLTVARELLGARLVRVDRGRRLSGWIVEAEAYIGPTDLACHAHVGRTARNEVMWGPPGHAYIYFTYGMHWCLNLVTEVEGYPAAVLIRAILPDEGVGVMRRRRGNVPEARVADGPAKVCQALGLDGRFNGHDLGSAEARLFVETRRDAPAGKVTRGPRVGLNTVPEPWKSKPWRFRLIPAHPGLFTVRAAHRGARGPNGGRDDKERDP